MYELPSELQKDLRSWRGSVRLSSELRPDLSKPPGSDDQFSARNQSSIILVGSARIIIKGDVLSFKADLQSSQHPTASNQALNYHHTQHAGAASTTQQSGLRQQRLPSFCTQRHAVTKAGQDDASSQLTADLDPAATRAAQDNTPLKITDFYRLIGMKPPMDQNKSPRSLEAANGLYQHIRIDERNVNHKYRAYDFMITILLVVQLLLAAVFIILGSVKITHHITIAVLGGVSTVVAGTLALARGQGLPNRLRMERDALRKVIFEADELYWDVGAGVPVTYGDVKKLREAYLKVLDDAMKNHPDQWTSSPEMAAQGSQAPAGGHPAVAMVKTIFPIKR